MCGCDINMLCFYMTGLNFVIFLWSGPLILCQETLIISDVRSTKVKGLATGMVEKLDWVMPG